MANFIFRSILAGMLISIGGCAMISSQLPIVGPVLFSFGLLCVLMLDCRLYTGAIGYAKLSSIPYLMMMFGGNVIGTFVIGTMMKFYNENIAYGAYRILEAKQMLISNPVANFDSILIAGIMCGILMYLAVEIWRSNVSDAGRCIGVMFAVAIFIISGYEHCIADCFYLFSASENAYSVINQVYFILTVALGNSIGSICTNKIKNFAISN